MSEASTSVNTNTSTVAEPVTAGGGEAPVSWDQLESVGNYRQETAKLEAKEDLKAEKEAKKELKVKDVKPDQEKEAKPAKEKADKAEKTDKAEQVAKAEAKKIKAKQEDGELELSADVKVPVKIDGKTEEVTLQEALNRYSQQKHLDKLYQDLKKEKAAFDSERGTIKQTLDLVKQSLTQKADLRSLIEAVAEPLGLDPAETYQQVRERLEKDFEEAQALTPEERRAKTAEEELAHFKQKQMAERQRQLELKSRQELEQSVEQVITEVGMDKAAFVKSYDELVNLGFKPEDLTPQQIGAYYNNMKTISLVESKIAELNPEAAQDAAEVERVATLILRNGATPEEIDEIIRQLYTSDADKKLAKKINRSISKSRAETPVKNAGRDPLFFDEI